MEEVFVVILPSFEVYVVVLHSLDETELVDVKH
jgi:hypothetical protein